MSVIIKNNNMTMYGSSMKVIKKVGYEMTCPSCKSVVRIEKKEIEPGCRPHEESWWCPCCHKTQYLIKYKKVTWLEEWEQEQT